MWKPSRSVLLVFVAAVAAGLCLNVLYYLLPHPLTAVFSPVCGSLWEQLKLFFWPYLAAMLLLTKGAERGSRVPWAVSLLLVCCLSLGLGYLIRVLWCIESFAIDLLVYFVLMAVGFLLPGLLWKCAASKWGDLAHLLVILLGAAVILFTFFPPDRAIFLNISLVQTWGTIPF